MNEDYITMSFHEEFARRIDEEEKRQNKRIEGLETELKYIRNLTSSVERLAVNMEAMLKEQERQGQRLEKLEGRDGEKWRTALKCIASALAAAVLAAVVGYVFARLGLVA